MITILREASATSRVDFTAYDIVLYRFYYGRGTELYCTTAVIEAIAAQWSRVEHSQPGDDLMCALTERRTEHWLYRVVGPRCGQLSCSAKLSRYNRRKTTLSEYRRGVAASAVAVRPVGERFGRPPTPLSITRLPLHQPILHEISCSYPRRR
ncbi:hypothetical protein EVAR_78372_1 [Eumeta japonica]|uniref:Uncharacterized protein n=1 Tax=Eumeta variegata TaxID=151549 RepID=A0A4C1T4A0_EUMVA|nr:hypothetical protein EVAR_78372_1 [Eumeta japonica]